MTARRNSPVFVTKAQAMEIRQAYSRGAGTKTVAALFGIGHGTVSLIITGQHVHTRGMRNISRGRGRKCSHGPGNTRGRLRCIHAQLAGTAAA